MFAGPYSPEQQKNEPGVTIPTEALQALEVLKALLGSELAGVWLHGSAVRGGLRRDSDVDILAAVSRGLTRGCVDELTGRLLNVSAKPGSTDGRRPLELIVVSLADIVPWHYPAMREYIYGEWLRDGYERGLIPGPAPEPDLALILAQARQRSVPLLGPAAADCFDPVPAADVRRAMKESLPGLVESAIGDERNVILTLARMWVTAATGEFVSKDQAASWAAPRLPKEHAALLRLAGEAYRGECADSWEGRNDEVAALVEVMRKIIEELPTEGACDDKL